MHGKKRSGFAEWNIFPYSPSICRAKESTFCTYRKSKVAVEEKDIIHDFTIRSGSLQPGLTGIGTQGDTTQVVANPEFKIGNRCNRITTLIDQAEVFLCPGQATINGDRGHTVEGGGHKHVRTGTKCEIITWVVDGIVTDNAPVESTIQTIIYCSAIQSDTILRIVKFHYIRPFHICGGTPQATTIGSWIDHWGSTSCKAPDMLCIKYVAIMNSGSDG